MLGPKAFLPSAGRALAKLPERNRLAAPASLSRSAASRFPAPPPGAAPPKAPPEMECDGGRPGSGAGSGALAPDAELVGPSAAPEERSDSRRAASGEAKRCVPSPDDHDDGSVPARARPLALPVPDDAKSGPAVPSCCSRLAPSRSAGGRYGAGAATPESAWIWRALQEGRGEQGTQREHAAVRAHDAPLGEERRGSGGLGCLAGRGELGGPARRRGLAALAHRGAGQRRARCFAEVGSGLSRVGQAGERKKR
jgi:hypothetical protein